MFILQMAPRSLVPSNAFFAFVNQELLAVHCPDRRILRIVWSPPLFRR